MKEIHFVEAKNVKKTVYRCECSLCGTTMEVDPKEFYYEEGYDLLWNCKHCNLNINRENIFLLQRKKIVYRSIIRFDVEK